MRYLEKIGPILAAALTALSISGCSGGDAPQPKPVVAPAAPLPPPLTADQKIAALVEKGDLPKLDRSEPLLGPDTNANSVRDDIEAIIAARTADPKQRSAAVQMARALQASLSVDTSNKAETDKVAQAMMTATKCLFERFPFNEGPIAPAALASELQNLTANSKPRLLAYLTFNTARNGSVSSVPKGETCE